MVDASRPARARAGSWPAPPPRPAQAFKRARVDALTLSTAESYEKPLTAFFKARERRR